MKKLTLSVEALKYYRKEANNFKNLDREILELKLTAMANNAEKLGYLKENVGVYKFGSFIMFIDEKNLRINTVTWRNELHKGYKMPKEVQNSLRKDYRALGLSNSGNSYLK